MDFSSFVTSLGTSFIIFVVLMLAFTWLQRKPGNAVIYYPNRILRGLDPLEGRIGTRNPLAWIREAVRASEADVIAAAGVDAAVYLVFVGSDSSSSKNLFDSVNTDNPVVIDCVFMGSSQVICSFIHAVLAILVLSGIVLLPILLPVASTEPAPFSTDSNSEGSFKNLDKLTMGHVNKRSPRLWAFLLGIYWVSFATYYVLWKAYEHVTDLRAGAKISPEVRPEEFAVLVRDIPAAAAGQSMKDHVESYFRSLHPETFYKSMVVTDNKEADKIWAEIDGYKKKLARAEAVYAKSKTTGNPEGMRPTNRIGFLGLTGEKVDTIEHCNEKIKELVPKLEAEQSTTLREKQKQAAIVFFNSKPAAASAAQTIHSQKIDRWTVIEAPEPRQLIWTNLPKKFYERRIRSLGVYGIVFLTVCFYMIPIAFVSGFTTVQNLKKYLPFTKKIVDQPEIRTVLEAYLPQIALIVFMALLPSFLMFLSKAEGIPSESHVVRATSGKYFYFIVFNVFLGVTIGGALIDSLKTLVNHPGDITSLLGESLPKSATFFLTYVALKFFVGYGLELSRVVPLIIFHLKKRYLCKTEAEVKEAWAPCDFGYATRIPNDMLIVTIVLCYSVIAPIIIPFGVVYFGLGWLIARNQALKVYVPSYESYGQMWPHMYLRIIASLIVYQVTMFGYIGLLREFFYAPLLIPIIVASFIFAYVCQKHFYLAFFHNPLEVASQGKKEIPNMEAIYTAFIPQCLTNDKFEGGDQFEDARSQSLRTTSF
ncbi:hypothetical protein ZIOFF_011841 [Zingiber officinale]|uniref:Uncharacterized protein n=1 Tax=Zingiber officinale TaxID=94328 RepID=A0A8J5HJU2_ZINOF|nr:hypothetical protein ZIOFF_011841 [Zingiber officinale]